MSRFFNRLRGQWPESPEQGPDMEAVRRGMVPWSAEEFWAVFNHEAELRGTPQDDWDRRPSTVTLTESDGTTREVRFNPDLLLSQVMRWLGDRYEGLPWTQIVSHMYRYLEIKGFVQEHQARLEEAGLLARDPDSDELMGIATDLVEVLATVPFEAEGPEEAGAASWTFDYDRVLERVRERAGTDEEPLF